jgi:hypothetical protein
MVATKGNGCRSLVRVHDECLAHFSCGRSALRRAGHQLLHEGIGHTFGLVRRLIAKRNVRVSALEPAHTRRADVWLLEFGFAT